jgi:hypothetical protein
MSAFGGKADIAIKGRHVRNDLGPSTIMGSDMPERQANVARSVNDGRLVRMLVVAQRK